MRSAVSSRKSSEDAFDVARRSNELLQSHGIDMIYTPTELQSEYVGFNFRGLLSALASKYNFTISPTLLDEYIRRELELCTENLANEAVECDGASAALENITKSGQYQQAVVSSSAMSRVVASLRKTGQIAYFDKDHIFSAASSMPQPSSKPDPAIYLFACEKLGVKPEAAVAIEDSKSGATAAIRAGINLIGYVGECNAVEIMYHWREFPEILKRIEAL